MAEIQDPRVAAGARLLRRMLHDRDSFNFISLASDAPSPELRAALAGALKRFDAVTISGRALDYDLALAALRARRPRAHRAGAEADGPAHGNAIWHLFTDIMDRLYTASDYRVEYGASELAREFGKRMTDRDSLLRQAYLNRVRVYCPSLLDSIVGMQLAIFSQDHDFVLNQIRDELELSNIFFDHKTTGLLMAGGMAGRHPSLWWNRFGGGATYALYVGAAPGPRRGVFDSAAVSRRSAKGIATTTLALEGDPDTIIPRLFAALKHPGG